MFFGIFNLEKNSRFIKKNLKKILIVVKKIILKNLKGLTKIIRRLTMDCHIRSVIGENDKENGKPSSVN